MIQEDFLSEEEKEIIILINLARANPEVFWETYFKNMEHVPDPNPAVCDALHQEQKDRFEAQRPKMKEILTQQSAQKTYQTHFLDPKEDMITRYQKFNGIASCGAMGHNELLVVWFLIYYTSDFVFSEDYRSIGLSVEIIEHDELSGSFEFIIEEK